MPIKQIIHVLTQRGISLFLSFISMMYSDHTITDAKLDLFK